MPPKVLKKSAPIKAIFTPTRVPDRGPKRPPPAEVYKANDPLPRGNEGIQVVLNSLLDHLERKDKSRSEKRRQLIELLASREGEFGGGYTDEIHRQLHANEMRCCVASADISSSMQRANQLARSLQSLLTLNSDNISDDQIISKYDSVANELEQMRAHRPTDPTKPQFATSTQDHYNKKHRYLAFDQCGHCFGQMATETGRTEEEEEQRRQRSQSIELHRKINPRTDQHDDLTAAAQRLLAEQSESDESLEQIRRRLEEIRDCCDPINHQIKPVSPKLSSTSTSSPTPPAVPSSTSSSSSSDTTTSSSSSSLEVPVRARSALYARAEQVPETKKRFEKRPKESDDWKVLHEATNADWHDDDESPSSQDQPRKAVATGTKRVEPFKELVETKVDDDSEESDFDYYPPASALALAQPGRQHKTHGSSVWLAVEREIRAQQKGKTSGRSRIEPEYYEGEVSVPDATEKVRMGTTDKPISQMEPSALGKGSEKPVWAACEYFACPGRRLSATGGLRRPRNSPFLSVGELSYFYSQMEEDDQSDLVSLLLSCRKLEKVLEDQHAVIDMLEQDLRQARSTTNMPPDELTAEQFTNMLDLDGNIPPDYFALPSTTSKFYSKLHVEASSAAARKAAIETEARLREFLVSDASRKPIHMPRILDKKPGAARAEISWKPPQLVTKQPIPTPGAVQPKPSPGAADVKPSPGAVQPKPSPGAVQPKPSPGAVQPKPSPGAVQPKPSPGAVQPKPSPGAVSPAPPSPAPPPPKPPPPKVKG